MMRNLIREVWSETGGSHPEEKSDQGLMDPTPKKIMSGKHSKKVNFCKLVPPTTTTTLTVLGPDGFAAGNKNTRTYIRDWGRGVETSAAQVTTSPSLFN